MTIDEQIQFIHKELENIDKLKEMGDNILGKEHVNPDIWEEEVKALNAILQSLNKLKELQK